MGVVACAGAYRQTWLVDLEIEVVILILTFGGNAFEGEDVEGFCVGDAVVDLVADIVACGEDLAAASRRENLKREVGGDDVLGRWDPLQITLVGELATNTSACPFGVDTVQSDA